MNPNRDLHDVVSHSIAMINVQAGVAVHVMDAQPEQARQALLTIKAARHEALRDLRAIPGVLRGSDEAQDRTPAPGLAELDDLVAPVRRSGLSVSMHQLNGRRQRSGETSLFLILTTFEADEYIFEALRAGASGFAVKDIEPAELLHAVRVVAAGQALLSPSVTARLIARFAARPARRRGPATELAVLTEREREILALVGQGKSNDDIAHELVVSPATVKTHVSRVMSKLDAHDRAQLVVTAYESGLVVPGG